MQYSKTTLMELSHKYRSILKKCALLNAAVLLTTAVALPAMADSAATIYGDETLHFDSFGEALASSSDWSKASGVVSEENQNITYDFAGKTYAGYKNPAGSSGTRNQVFQLLKGSDITFKNGTIKVAEDATTGFWMGIQNYSNLTLENMVIDGSNLSVPGSYALSNNQGTVNIKNSTILAKTGEVAFDLWYWVPFYTEGVFVNLENSKITGKIEIGTPGPATAADILTHAVLNISGDNTIDGDIENNGGTINVKAGTLTYNGQIKNSGVINFESGSSLKTALNGSTIISGTGEITGNTELVLGNGAAGQSFALQATTNTLNFKENSLYDFVPSVEGDTTTYTISKKSTDEIVDNLVNEGATAQEAATISAIADTTLDHPVLNKITEAVQTGDVKTAAKAAEDLAPTTSQQVVGVTKDVVSMLSNVASDRINPVGLAGGDVFEGFGMWAQGLYNRSKQDATASSEGFRANTRGIAVGLDGKLSKVMTVGIGYGYTDTDADAGARDVDVEGHHVFLYGQYKPCAWYAHWLLDYGYAKYDETKTPAGLSMKTSYNVHSYAAHYMAGYDFENGLMTEAGARYLLVDQDAYNDGLQRIKSDKNDTLTAVAGVKYQAVVKTDDVAFVPRLRLAATYDVKSEDSEANVQVVGGGNYQITGERLHRFGVEAGVGVTATVGAWDVSLDYFGGYRKDYQSHTGLLKAQYNF